MFDRKAAYKRAMTHLIETSLVCNDHEADRDSAIVLAYNRAAWASAALKSHDDMDFIDSLAGRAANMLVLHGITSRM